MDKRESFLFNSNVLNLSEILSSKLKPIEISLEVQSLCKALCCICRLVLAESWAKMGQACLGRKLPTSYRLQLVVEGCIALHGLPGQALPISGILG